MKLNQAEKIQFVFDFIGSLLCALMLGIICLFFVDPSSSPQPNVSKIWAFFHFSLPLLIYFTFIFVYLKTSFLGKLKFKLFCISTNFTCSIISLFLSFFIRDLAFDRFLTDKSKFIPFGNFLFVVGGIIGAILCFAATFWVVGLITGNVVANRGGLVKINLEN